MNKLYILIAILVAVLYYIFNVVERFEQCPKETTLSPNPPSSVKYQPCFVEPRIDIKNTNVSNKCMTGYEKKDGLCRKEICRKGFIGPLENKCWQGKISIFN
jgi:hypothetical protein